MTHSKEEEKKPLDMTTDEAINFLFPKVVVDKLKEEAARNPAGSKHLDDLDDNGDSAYKNNSK